MELQGLRLSWIASTSVGQIHVPDGWQEPNRKLAGPMYSSREYLGGSTLRSAGTPRGQAYSIAAIAVPSDLRKLRPVMRRQIGMNERWARTMSDSRASR